MAIVPISPPRQPQTHAGLFIRASLLNQEKEKQRLIGRLNGGKPGWNDDEPAVFQAAFELALQVMFPAGADVRDITHFVADLRSRLSQGSAPGQLEAEALMRRAMGDSDVVISGISRMDAFKIYSGVTHKIVFDLHLSEPDVNRLVVDAEKLAFDRGRQPPLAD